MAHTLQRFALARSSGSSDQQAITGELGSKEPHMWFFHKDSRFKMVQYYVFTQYKNARANDIMFDVFIIYSLYYQEFDQIEDILQIRTFLYTLQGHDVCFL